MAGNTASRVEQLIAPTVRQMGYDLWDVRFVKEGASWYLRIFIDKPEGIDINDCTDVSHAVDPLLDEADPIDGSYTLEVGSAGAERALKRPADFQRYLESPVLVKLYRNLDGRKEFAGHLKAYNEQSGAVTITMGAQELTFEKKDVALVRLRVEF